MKGSRVRGDIVSGMPSQGYRTPIYVLWFWASAAIAVVALDLFARLPVVAAQGAIAGQMLVFFALLAFAPRFREYLFSRDLRLLTLFHLWRVIPGALFLYYYHSLHRLPWSFAVPGGYGDIAVAATAPLAAMLPASSWNDERNDKRSDKHSGKWKALLVWQALGFLDLAGVVRAGLVNGLHDPESMRALTHFPLSFLPAILVPLTFIMHIAAMAQIVRGWRKAAQQAPVERPL